MNDDLPLLGRLQEVTPPALDVVRSRVTARRTRRRAVGGGLALAATALIALAVGQEGPTQRDRGAEGPPALVLEAFAEGRGAPRALASGARVGPDERVVFVARSDVPTHAVLSEGPARVWPPSGTWQLGPTAAPVGGASPRSWRPDGRSGPLRYELIACRDAEALAASDPACARQSLELVWTP